MGVKLPLNRPQGNRQDFRTEPTVQTSGNRRGAEGQVNWRPVREAGLLVYEDGGTQGDASAGRCCFQVLASGQLETFYFFI